MGRTRSEIHDEAIALVREGFVIAHDQVQRGRYDDARSVLAVISDLLGRSATESVVSAA